MNGDVSKDRSRQKGRKVSAKVKVLGSIVNLEEHVQPDWWRQIFNSVYLKTDADVVDDPKITRKEVDLISEILKLSPGDRILDLCCGQGRHSLELGRRGYQIIDGLDRSRYLIQKARAQAKKEGLNIKFREGDARKLPYPADTFDAVTILGNSFGYFETTQEDMRVLKETFRVLKPWGRILIDIADGEYLREHFQPRSWEWIDKKHFVCRERSLSLDKQRLISREVVTHVEKGVIADQFYAEILNSSKQLSELLESAGFSNIVIEGTMGSDSQRNQDLGMMEKRIILTATVKKKWSAARKEKETVTKNVAVLLGDPAKPDPLKPLCLFNEDDFYTIDQLKSALRELKGYRFSYFSNHDTLLHDLSKMRTKFDFFFNLCDEGFNNDATKELHIPSLLEILGIPYTGSGPQCLSFCYDKSLVRGISNEMGIPVPKAFFIRPQDTVFEFPLEFPVLVKPNLGDSSFGITQRSISNSFEELVNVISEIKEKFGYDKPILVEEFLSGKDISVGIIGNLPDTYTVLPVIEEDYSALPPELPRICGYEAKWLPESPYSKIKSVPAQLEEDKGKYIVECCLKLFERLDCRDYCRFDWRLDSKGNPKLLEVNPNPGWCWDGHLAKMCKFGGISYTGMLERILQAFQQRMSTQAVHVRREEEHISNIMPHGI